MSEFNLKSGNTSPFKMMGASPAKSKGHGKDDVEHAHPSTVQPTRFGSVTTAESTEQLEKNKAARKAAITATSTEVRELSGKELRKQVREQKKHLRSVDQKGGKGKPGLISSKKKKQAWLSAQKMKGIDVGSYFEGGERIL